MFREGGALGPSSSMPFHPVRPIDSRIFARLCSQGIIVKTGANAFYLDEAALIKSNERRRIRVAVALCLVAAATAIVLWITFGPH